MDDEDKKDNPIDYDKFYEMQKKAVAEAMKEQAPPEPPKPEAPTWAGFYAGKCEEPKSAFSDYIKDCPEFKEVKNVN